MASWRVAHVRARFVLGTGLLLIVLAGLVRVVVSHERDYVEDGAGDALIGGRTYEALGTHRAEFECTDLGELQVADETAPVRVWAVAGLKRGM